MRQALKYFAIWCSIIPFAILNGYFREYYLFPAVGNIALPVSGLILILVILGIGRLAQPVLRLQSLRQAWLAGLFWVFLTILFELVLSLLSGEGLDTMLKAYDIRSGNLWSLVVATSGIAPVFGYLLNIKK